MLHRTRSLLSPVLAISLATPLCAQAFETTASLSSALGAIEPITRAVASDLDNDRAIEVIFLEGNTLKIQYGAFTYDAVVDTGLTVSDIAVANGRATSGADALLICDANGLHLVEYTPGSAEDFTRTALDTSVWAGAQRVVTMNNASGVGTVAGITADGEDVAVLTEAFSGAPVASTIEVPGQVLDVAVAEWSDSPLGGIAVATTTGFYIYSASGAQIRATPVDFEHAMLGVITSPGSTSDRIVALVRGYSSNFEYLYVLGHGVPTEYFPLGEVDSYAMVADDLNGDGHTDLVVAHRLLPFTTGPMVLFNASQTGPTFSWADGEVLDLGVGIASGNDQRATPVIADARLDGDKDVIVYSHAVDAMALVEGTTFDHTDHELIATSVQAVGWTSAMQVDMRVSFELPEVTIANPTHLLIDQWAASWKSGKPSLQSVGIAKQFTPLGIDTPLEHLSVILPGYVFGGHKTLRVIVLRLGELSPAGEVLNVGPATRFVAAMDADDVSAMTSEAVTFLGLLNPTPPIPGTHPGGAVLGGGLDPLPTPPPFDPMSDPPQGGALSPQGEISFE